MGRPVEWEDQLNGRPVELGTKLVRPIEWGDQINGLDQLYGGPVEWETS